MGDCANTFDRLSSTEQMPAARDEYDRQEELDSGLNQPVWLNFIEPAEKEKPVPLSMPEPGSIVHTGLKTHLSEEWLSPNPQHRVRGIVPLNVVEMENGVESTVVDAWTSTSVEGKGAEEGAS